MTQSRAHWALGLILSAFGAVMLTLFSRAENELRELAKNVTKNTAILVQQDKRLDKLTDFALRECKPNADRQLQSQ